MTVDDNTVDPLTSLPPLSRYLLQVDQYAVVSCLTFCVWDWLLSVSDEVEMIRHGDQRRRFVYDFLYLVVRICPIIYLSAIIILTEQTDTGIIENLILLEESLNVIIMPAASALFFIRLSAVYPHNILITSFFASSWLVIFCLFIFDSATSIIRCSEIIQPTYCLRARRTDAWGYIAIMIYDTLMYIVISWQLASFATVDNWHNRLRSLVTGDGLGWLSKVLLQSGQMYYFITITFSICTTMFIYKPLRPQGWNAMVIPPNITVATIMACRIFRELKLGLIMGPITEGALSKLVFKDIESIAQFQRPCGAGGAGGGGQIHHHVVRDSVVVDTTTTTTLQQHKIYGSLV